MRPTGRGARYLGLLAFAADDRAVVVFEERSAALLGSVRQHLEWLALESFVVAVVVVLVAPALAEPGPAGEADDGHHAPTSTRPSHVR